MANTRHIYSKEGEHVYYRVGDNIYEPGGVRAFWVSGTWWHSHEGGAEYYERGNWIYSKDGDRVVEQTGILVGRPMPSPGLSS